MTRKYYGDEGRHVEKLNQHLVKSKARSLLKLQVETKKMKPLKSMMLSGIDT